MRRRILIGIAAFFYYSGLVGLARWWTRHRRQGLVILNYHRATGGDLRRHFLYLLRHYRIMHIESALEELYTRRKGRIWSKDALTPLVVTFDDGYADNYSVGFTLARELQVPISIYLVPGYIDSGAYFWWGEGERLVKRAQVSSAHIVGRDYDLQRGEDRTALKEFIDHTVRHACSVAEREAFLANVCDALAVPPTILDEELPALPVSWEQVREMDESGWVSFGAHTMHHPVLAYLKDKDEMVREIRASRLILQERLGHSVRTFAYPIGQRQHISDAVVQTVREAGYEWALTTHYGLSTAQSNPYLLQRIETDVDQHWLVLAAEAAGLWGFFSRLRWIPFIRKYLTNARSNERREEEHL